MIGHIADCKFKGKDICILRDKQGKFFIKVDGVTTQKRLNASELARWFCQTMHESINPEVSPLMLRIKLSTFY